MIKKLYNIYLKYKEIINYLFFGGLTTLVNFVIYFIASRLLHIDPVISNAAAWLLAVLFAYVTNKLFVFESKRDNKKDNAKEIGLFFLFRIISGLLCDQGTFALMIKVFHINDIISKIVTQIMVIVVNYVFSKFIIFRKKTH